MISIPFYKNNLISFLDGKIKFLLELFRICILNRIS
jgi:hypothetical protein